ncbi:MAG: hypothetical protein ACSLFI_03380 [Solirubrobacterales bacterium]
MVSTLTTSNMLTPPVPASLVGSLRALPWAWGTTSDIEPLAVYLKPFDVLAQGLSDEFGDFWMYGHRGHGINSYGIGMLARVGGMFVAQQHGHGGAYMIGDTEKGINQANQAWSHLLKALPIHPERCSVGVLFSDYRGDQCIISNHPDDLELAIVKDTRGLPAGWHYLYANNAYYDSNQDLSHLERLRTSGRTLTRLAASHLWRLLHPGQDNGPHTRARRNR